ncbi:MAG: hypothetical protein ACN6NI_06035 [Acinetobacter sp.]
MHQTVKTIFRLCFAGVIFLITLSLCFTCFAKMQEILQAKQHYQQATNIPLKSTAGEQYVLLSNNQRPDNAIFILIAGNGYVAKINCEHYSALCSDDDNQSHTRQIQTVDLIKAGNLFYIEKIQFRDSRTGKATALEYSKDDIQQFYQNDISNLKYIVFAIALFALAALFVSFKILKNFRRFLQK